MALCGPIQNPTDIPTDQIAYLKLLISTYFPESQWENAWCIVTKECPPDVLTYVGGCVKPEGMVQCNPEMPFEDSRSWGAFGLLDICWDPSMNSKSPFMTDQWAHVLDPNMNTWMASVIWANYGWAAWSTANLCNLLEVGGGVIPHPEGPNPALSVYNPPGPCVGGGTNWTLVVGIGMVGLGLLLSLASGER